MPLAPNSTGSSETCLAAIRDGDPAAARMLYELYADQIRAYLRRHTGIQDVEQSVYSILLEAVHSVREQQITSIQDLSETIRELSQQSVFGLRRRAAAKTSDLNSEGRREVVNGLFTALDQREREILLRSLLLHEQDDEISSDLDLPRFQVERTRAKARVLLRISA